MRQNKILVITTAIMQILLNARFSESLHFPKCELKNIDKWTIQDNHHAMFSKVPIHCENRSLSKIQVNPLQPRNVASFPENPAVLFKVPEAKKKHGLVNFLPEDSSSSFTKMSGKEEILPLIVEFLNYVANRYLYGCISIVLYDDYYETRKEFALRSLLVRYPVPRVHGRISRADMEQSTKIVDPPGGMCRHFILLLRDLSLLDLVGNQSISYVVIFTEAPTSEIQQFLTSGLSHGVVNLLVATPGDQRNKEPTLVLRTHELYSGDEDSSRVLTSWRRDGLTRDVDLFPEKLRRGFNGRRFVVAASDQPHYVIHRNVSGDDASEFTWEGLEIRLLKLLSQTLNFKIAYKNFPATDKRSGQASGVVKELMNHRAHVGVAGLYTTNATLNYLTLSAGHSVDCATFITRTSLALPRYRAIMGPFHWSVWLTLTLTYLFAIFPVAFSHKHSLRNLLKNPWEMENMFWYVFGTFTNCFTFSGKQSWTSTDKNATRMFIGTYWMFSIIVTACYTGSIIAFVTLPLYPEFINSARQVYESDYEVAMLDGEGWQHYFNNSCDPIATKILKKVKYLAAIEDGLRNLTKKRNTRYAVFGSRDKLDFILRANFTHGDASKRALLHIAKECFVPFHVALAFPRRAPHSDMLNQVLLRAVQSGLVLKVKRDVEWEMRRSITGKFLQASSAAARVSTKPLDRMLSLDDVQGNFLLLGAGFAIAFLALFLEVITWFMKEACNKYYRCRRTSTPNSINEVPVTDETFSQKELDDQGTSETIENRGTSNPMSESSFNG